MKKIYVIKNDLGVAYYATDDYEYAQKFIEYIAPNGYIEELNFNNKKVREKVDTILDKYNGKKLYKCIKEPHMLIEIKRQGINECYDGDDTFYTSHGKAIATIFAKDEIEAENKFRKMMDDYIEEEKLVAEFRKQLREKRKESK